MELEDRNGYSKLLKVLSEAYDQASIGKGKERHSHGGEKPFEQQQILTGQRKYGMGFALGQADKKMEEAFHMQNWASARRDLLGAVNYISAAIIYGDEIDENERNTEELILLDETVEEEDEFFVKPPVDVEE